MFVCFHFPLMAEKWKYLFKMVIFVLKELSFKKKKNLSIMWKRKLERSLLKKYLFFGLPIGKKYTQLKITNLNNKIVIRLICICKFIFNNTKLLFKLKWIWFFFKFAIFNRVQFCFECSFPVCSLLYTVELSVNDTAPFFRRK